MSLSREDLQATLAELDATIQQIDAVLKPVVAKPLAETTRDMEPIENAKLQVLLAYTMNTLFYLYMRLQNANLVGHGLVKDMERLKEYMKKIEGLEAPDQPAKTLNKGAAARFISAALAGNKLPKSGAAAEDDSADAPEQPDGAPDA